MFKADGPHQSTMKECPDNLAVNLMLGCNTSCVNVDPRIVQNLNITIKQNW